MTEIIKVYKEPIPALRMIGKRYTNADRRDGNFGHCWGQWFENGWFDVLAALGPAKVSDSEHLGFMRCYESEFDSIFEYWIGQFFPPGTVPPEGFGYIDLPAGELAVAWIRSDDDNEIFSMEYACEKRFQRDGLKWWRDAEGREHFFERYNESRFLTPDADGNVILDYCTYLA